MLVKKKVRLTCFCPNAYPRKMSWTKQRSKHYITSALQISEHLGKLDCPPWLSKYMRRSLTFPNVYKSQMTLSNICFDRSLRGGPLVNNALLSKGPKTLRRGCKILKDTHLHANLHLKGRGVSFILRPHWPNETERSPECHLLCLRHILPQPTGRCKRQQR